MCRYSVPSVPPHLGSSKARTPLPLPLGKSRPRVVKSEREGICTRAIKIMAKGAEFRIDKQDRINYFPLVKRPRLLRVVIATCALSLFSTANPANADGSLDTSFDTDGKITTAIGSAADYGRSVAIQSDGKIVAAGHSYNGSDDDFSLARYNTDGSLDTSFDTDGKVTTGFDASDA